MMGFESPTSHFTVSDMSSSAFFSTLSHEGVLSVQGPDAAKFLQGQLTCNIDYLDAGHSSLGARCTPKGRMTSSFRIVAHGEGYLLAMTRELVEQQLTDLKKYAVFSKVRLADVSTDWVRFGIQTSDAQLPFAADKLAPRESGAVTMDGEVMTIRLDEQRLECWVSSARAEAIEARLSDSLSRQPLNAWLLSQVRAGVGQVFSETRELFIPQMINLQAVGGVSFRKGCYAGQEIVARMQYLGKLKRRMYRLNAEVLPAPVAGTELFSPVHGSSVGEVVLAAESESGCELLAVVQEDALQDGRLTLGTTQGPALQLLDLPYQLDRDREIQR